MTKDEIIRMAREAGFELDKPIPIWLAYPEELEHFAALVAAHEREACANLCSTAQAIGMQSIREACAAAIRARGEK